MPIGCIISLSVLRSSVTLRHPSQLLLLFVLHFSESINRGLLLFYIGVFIVEQSQERAVLVLFFEFKNLEFKK